ncbi:MAG: glycosyltransferase family 4 protein [Alphaproteobacteria bacterium]|nr:glycosyltransferase family 4 protein [Alphaproteobacteria bacterium]
MNILICNYEYPPLGGGGGVVTAQLVEQLAKRHEVTVLTSRAFDLPEQSRENGADVIRVPVLGRTKKAAGSLPSLLSYVPMAIRRGKALMRTRSFDVINTHFAVPTGPVGDVLARRGNISNILSVHGGDLYDPSKGMSPHRHWVLRRLIRGLLKRADHVVGQSRNTVANVGRFYTTEVLPALIPLGIERPSIEPAARADYGLGEDDVLLVTVGRLVARKALGQLLDILARSGDRRVKLLVIGTGPEQAALVARAAELGIAEHVRFLGALSDQEKFNVLGMADLYVSSSQHEGFGLVFLEGMAAGLPVVCYDHGGQTDFLVDGETGFLVPLNDQEKLAKCIQDLVIDATLRQKIADNNQKRVEPYFIEQMALAYEQLFEAAIRDRCLASKSPAGSTIGSQKAA